MKIKTETPNDFTESNQAQLDAITEQIVDLEDLKEQIELSGNDNEQVANKDHYQPKPGTEKLVHLLITRGRRFDENTGKEVSKPYVQTFTYGEYKNFIKNAELIGYNIVKELYNPYKD